MSYTPQSANTWSGGSVTRSLVTGTGATGFQVSTTKDASVSYNVKISVTATIGSQAEGYIALEVSPTNSSTPSDWVETARYSNGQSITLAITLQSVQPTGGQLSADIPAGYWVKLRQVTLSGSPTYSYISGYESVK